MSNLYLPGFHLAILCSKPRSEVKILADQLAEMRRKSIGQLANGFTGFISEKTLQSHRWGRQRSGITAMGALPFAGQQ